MSEIYEECFADEESGYGSAVDENNKLCEVFHKESVTLDENECVFDKNWAWERKCSMSSLLYSRLSLRLRSISAKRATSFQLHCKTDSQLH